MKKYLYICSAGRSGSTLLDMLLGAHTSVASLGEINQLSKNISLNTPCSCGEPIRSCAVWRPVLRQLSEELAFDVETSPYRLHLGYPLASRIVDQQHQTATYVAKRQLVHGMHLLLLRLGLIAFAASLSEIRVAIDNRIRVFEAVRRVQNVEIVVDSSKTFLDAITLHHRAPHDVRVILLVRDGRGVLWSNLKSGIPRDRAVKNWRNRYARALPLIRRYLPDDHWLQVRYEDLTENPSDVLTSICRLAGIRFEDDMLEFRRKTHHILNGNNMRFSTDSHIRPDLEWRSRMSAADLRYFEEHAGWFNRELGYH